MEIREWKIGGMTCASCVNRVEGAISAVPGVRSARVNLATETARVEWDSKSSPADGVEEAAVADAIERAGYRAEPKVRAESVREPVDGSIRSSEVRGSGLRSFIGSLALTLPLIAPMVAMPFGFHAALPGAVQFALAAIVQFGFGARFYLGSFRALRGGFARMDVLVALGTSAAFGISVYALATGDAEAVYFETSAAVITFVLLGKWLEGRSSSRRRSAARARVPSPDACPTNRRTHGYRWTKPRSRRPR